MSDTQLVSPSNLDALRAATIEPFRMSYSDFDLVKTPGYRFKIRNIPDEALEILRAETSFSPDTEEDLRPWPADQARAIGLDQIPCPKCDGDREVLVPHTGKVTGIKVNLFRPCKCIIYRRFYERWEDPRNVGQDYRNVRLNKLRNFAMNFRSFLASDKLDELIDVANEYRGNSYLLAGPHGQGKTTLMMALYCNALAEWAQHSFYRGTSTPAVFMANATTLSAEFRAWEMKDEGRGDDEGPPTPLPAIMDTHIRSAVKAGLVPRIFIEEIDKFKLDSEFQRKMFSRIIDAVHSAGGQIVATSNLSDTSLKNCLGDQYGGGIIRRIIGPRGNPGIAPIVDAEGKTTYPMPDLTKGGWYVDFWNSSMEQNKQEAALDAASSQDWEAAPRWNGRRV